MAGTVAMLVSIRMVFPGTKRYFPVPIISSMVLSGTLVDTFVTPLLLVYWIRKLRLVSFSM